MTVPRSPSSSDPASTRRRRRARARRAARRTTARGSLSDDAAFAALAAAPRGHRRDRRRRRAAPAARADGAAASIALVGLGSGPLTADALRYAAGSAARQLTGVESLALALPARPTPKLLAVLEGAAIGAYAYTDTASRSLETTKLPASRDHRAHRTPTRDAELVERAARGRRRRCTPCATWSTRRRPTSTRRRFADARASSSPTACRSRSTVLDETSSSAGGFGGILGVGRARPAAPRLVKRQLLPRRARPSTSPSSARASPSTPAASR